MVKVDKVWGSEAQAKPLVIIGDNVYIHTDIKQLGDNLYEYVEYQCTLSEFLTAVFSTQSSEELLNLLGVTKE